MSLSSSKSRFNDRKAGKESQKNAFKPSGHVNSGKRPVSGYSSLLGKYHAPVTTPPPSSDEVEGQTSTLLQNDPVSDKDSLSVKSEDIKDKISPQDTLDQEEMPWTEIEKKEKTRQKNEKKHQRQKEKRAQELHERCCSFLMSKKLKTLTQKLVAMGFPSERARRSLIMTKGKIEQSIAWLLETAEGADQPQLGNVNLKIDIAEELAKMAEMASKNSCSKQDMEKAVIACDGDLEKVAEALLLQKPFPPVKAEETIARAQTSMTPLKSKETLAQVQNPIMAKPKHHRMEEKVSSYAKAVPVSSVTVPKLEWAKPQTQYGPIKNTDVKNLQFGSINEPVVGMQHPQSSNLDHEPIVVSQGPQLGNLVHAASGGQYKANDTSFIQVQEQNTIDNSFIMVQDQQHQQFEDVFNYSHVGSPLSVASSLGLFSGLGHPNGFKLRSSPTDWNVWAENLSGVMLESGDYTRVDWTVNRGGSWGLRMGTEMSQSQNDYNHHLGFDPQAGMMGMMEASGGGHIGQGVNSGEEASSAAGAFREWSSPLRGRICSAIPGSLSCLLPCRDER